jgi:hypothetical protein
VAHFAVTLVVWIVLELRQRLRTRREAAQRDAGSLQVVALTIGAGW